MFGNDHPLPQSALQRGIRKPAHGNAEDTGPGRHENHGGYAPGLEKGKHLVFGLMAQEIITTQFNHHQSRLMCFQQTRRCSNPSAVVAPGTPALITFHPVLSAIREG